jgi:hypothetical protein
MNGIGNESGFVRKRLLLQLHQDYGPMKAAIFGSCVSRDTAEFMPEVRRRGLCRDGNQ